MSETTTASTETTEANTEATEPTYTAPASQADLDRIINGATAKVHKRYEGFDDFQAKASKLDEIEEANKTELQKYQEKLTELESENGKLKGETLRSSVASDKGVPASLLSGSSKEELEASADALLEFKGKQAGPIVTADGTASAAAAGGSDWLRRELTKK